MPSSTPLILSPQAFAAARANFIAFYRTQGWEDLNDDNVDVLELDGRLGELWQGWLDRSRLANLQAIEGPSDVNDWYLSLESGHQKVLVEDKWALANAAYREGLTKHVNQVVVDVASAAGTSVVVEAPIEASQNETLKLRIAQLEKALEDTAEALQGMEGLPAEKLAEKVFAALGDIQTFQPRLLMPPEMVCDDGYPSDDMLEANAWNRCMAKIASMNGHLKTDFVTNASASNPFWPKLRCKAKVGRTIFSAGVSSRSLVAAAERAYEYSQNPPFELERLGRLDALLKDIHAAPPADAGSQEPGAEKVKALLWNELAPGGYWLFPMKQILIDRDPHPEYVQVDGTPGDLYVQHEGSTYPLDAVYSGYQFVKGVRVERDEVEFHPTYKISGRAIATQEDAQ
jgi:hypothetical protein